MRRNGVLLLGGDGTWSVAEGGRALGTLDGKLYRRLYEVKTEGRGAIRSTSTYQRCCASTVTAASRCASTGTWSGD